jgi:hypothetical protein
VSYEYSTVLYHRSQGGEGYVVPDSELPHVRYIRLACFSGIEERKKDGGFVFASEMVGTILVDGKDKRCIY